MQTISFLVGALLAAAPAFSQTVPAEPVSDGDVKWFRLVETESEVRSRLGQPMMVADFGQYRSWQYRLEHPEHEGVHSDGCGTEFSYSLVFRRSDGKLVSVTRKYDPQENVDRLFPSNETVVRWFHSAGQPDFPVRVRRLAGGRVLMAFGVSKPGQSASQLVLMRESELRHFYSWLELD
jgi:hypothetical protein